MGASHSSSAVVKGTVAQGYETVSNLFIIDQTCTSRWQYFCSCQVGEMFAENVRTGRERNSQLCIYVKVRLMPVMLIWCGWTVYPRERRLWTCVALLREIQDTMQTVCSVSTGLLSVPLSDFLWDKNIPAPARLWVLWWLLSWQTGDSSTTMFLLLTTGLVTSRHLGGQKVSLSLCFRVCTER